MNNLQDTITKDKHGDYLATASNPVNIDPQYMGDYPPPKFTTSKIPDLPPPTQSTTESPAINRPPKSPGEALGPFFQFITTDLNRMLWIGSALVFRHVSYTQPHIEFLGGNNTSINYTWEILYENIFDLRAYRVNIFIRIPPGENDEKISWKIDWGEKVTTGQFYIAQFNQKWRGGFFSCNGFDATVTEDIASDLTYSNVWNHLLSVHKEKPFHVLLWGGDQNYIDFIFEDIPFLRAWVNMEWNQKWTTDFRQDLQDQVEQYHFNTYAENWNRRDEVRNALSSIPSLMTWDDHDIFDGAGSYPPLIHDSPMMMGLFHSAQKMRLLFQHHTTLAKARQHYLFGYQGYNFFAQCGPNLVIIGTDGRSERTTERVHEEKTWQMIYNQLETASPNVKHAIILFPVPFSFVRVRIAETIFEHLKNLPNKMRNVPLVKQTNSIFGLPELYDDLLDEWTHENHIEERNRALARFQQISREKNIRITFFSGDVHCCGISRFQTDESEHSPSIYDHRLMYQIISSAIVNMPPSKMAIRVAHRFKTKWNPIDHTEEEVIDFFERKPETGGKVFHKKFRPNRNWCYFEQCDSTGGTFPISLGPTSTQDGEGSQQAPIHHHSHGKFCHEHDQHEICGTSNLKIRLWLESAQKHDEGRQFVAFDLLIPNLEK
ncbi:unnamed protein product [Adineta ricciae]|uniref:PhoD-like phosphatase domain-containing protein n=3 Tax=Adineta ricciae TaxID=249248 RepID=A0A815M011_ADIRI|nr:unnamed protein product [Adineta ricciae]